MKRSSELQYVNYFDEISDLKEIYSTSQLLQNVETIELIGKIPHIDEQ